MELVVVGRSEDTDAFRVVEELALHATFPVRWIEVETPGQIAAFKEGVASSSGDFIAFLDDDSEPQEGWLRELLDPLRDESVACVGGATIETPPSTASHDAGRIRWYGRFMENVGASRGESPRAVHGVTECTCIWRRSILEQLEIDPTWDELGDAFMWGVDLGLQAIGKGFLIIYQPKSLCIHHLAPRDDDAWPDRQQVDVFSRNYTYIALKHFPLHQRIFFIAWWWGVGLRVSYGLLKAAIDLVISRERSEMFGRLLLAFRGKRLGVQAWRRKKRQSSISEN